MSIAVVVVVVVVGGGGGGGGGSSAPHLGASQHGAPAVLGHCVEGAVGLLGVEEDRVRLRDVHQNRLKSETMITACSLAAQIE